MLPIPKKQKKKHIHHNVKHVSKEHTKADKVYRFLFMATAAGILLVILRMASVIVAPMLMALFLTIILIVPLRWLQKKGCPKVIALIIVLGCTAVICIGIGLLVGRSLNDFVRQFPMYKTKITEKFNALDKNLEQFGFAIGKKTESVKPDVPDQNPLDIHQNDLPAPLEPNGSDEEKTKKPDAKSEISPIDRKIEPDRTKNPVPDGSSTDDFEGVFFEDDETDAESETGGGSPPEEIPDTIESIAAGNMFNKGVRDNDKPSLIELNTESVMYWVGTFIRELRHLAESGFLVIIITLFMISEAARFPEKVDWALGKAGPINYKHLHHIAAEIRRYLFIKAIACIMSSTAATLVYLLFDVPGALLWGVVAFFLYFIPNIGGVIAAIIPGLLIFMALDIEGVLLYAVCLVTIECSIGYGIEPHMLGHGLGISTVVIFLSLLLWGWILGPVGLFLAAPLTIMVKIILQAFKETEWIAILLGDKNHPDEPKSVIES